MFGRRGTTNDNLIAENFVEIGLSINSISFHSLNSKIGEHLLNYKKYFGVDKNEDGNREDK